jgi:nascent polypeptide-associated complex subunit alpha
MIPGMNPRQMAQAMKRLGIQQVEIPATEVIIRTADKELVIDNPQVSKVNMMGQETIQVIGTIREREIYSVPEISEDDVKTVMDQAGVSEAEAKKAIKDNDGDLAAAILSLQKS